MKQQKSITRRRRLIINYFMEMKKFEIPESQAKTVQNVHWKLRQNGGHQNNNTGGSETEIVIMNEPFPPELDFAQITGQNDFRPSMPPPPPPRDPKRRLYLSGSPSCQLPQQHRPVSYAFEKPDVVQNPPPPGRPRAASAIITSGMLPARPRSSSSSNGFVAQSHVYPSHRILPETPPPPPEVVVRNPRRPIVKEEAAKQGNCRATSASSYFRYSSFPDLVQPQMEYWKSPPPPFVPTFDPNLVKEEEIDELLPPPRPPRPNLRKKLSNTSNDSRGRDSAIGSTFGPSPLLPSGQLGGMSM